ncbi:MAG: HlyD family type I secretion periplasmic adaptor subunit [Limnohabitans sp.]|nr:HlyD family type I secretion periplasmic adaptor subunit [Limnohabitans sp.]
MMKSFLVALTVLKELCLGPGGSANRTSRYFLWVLFLSLLVFLGWASVSQFEQVISSEARIIPYSKLQTIQHLEGGLIQSIHVAAGQVVKQGDELITLSPLESVGGLETKKYELMQSRARVLRLESEHAGKLPVFPRELEKFSPGLVANEMSLAVARKARIDATLASFDSQLRQRQSELQGAKRSLSLVKEEFEAMTQLVERGLEPKLEAVRSEKAFAEAVARVESITGALDEIRDRRSASLQDHRSETLSELAKARAELSQIEQVMPVAQDKMLRSTIRSPMDGIVNRVLVSTQGGVIKAGEPAVEIVPVDSKLMFELKVRPGDIGFVQVGQKAMIKLSTYDFSIFGSLTGRVEVVGSDAINNERGDFFYLVKVDPLGNESSIGKKLALLPGMTAQVDIITGKRSVLSYITSPISRTTSMAFKEK